MRRLLLVTLLLGLATGCGGEQTWHTKDISGLMPELAFTLISENGETVTADNYTGKVNLLFFGYTNCPDVCPITLGRLRGVINRLPEDVAGRVQVLFVSVDPRRDDPDSLRSYTASFGEDFIGLTGTTEQLDALTKRYRTTYGYGEPDENGDYLVSHGSAVYAFDSNGEARLLIRDGDDMDAVAEDLAALARD
jgi:protein SCO1/2